MNTSITQGLSPSISAWHRFWWHVRDHVVPHERNHYQPHLLHHRTLVVLSVLLVTVKITSFSLLEFAPGAEVVASAITQESVLELTNRSRVAASIPPLTYNTTLEKAAQLKADDMLARQYFAHNTPDGKTPWTFFDRVGYAYLSAGENLAVHFSDVEPLQDAWMNSPGHRANILNSTFKEMGVGIARGTFEGHESVFVVEEFGNPAVVTASAEVALAKADEPKRSQVKAVEITKPVESVPASSSLTTVSGSELETPSSETLAPLVASPAVVTLQPIRILNTQAQPVDGKYVVTAHTTANVSKLLLSFGDKARFFSPGGDGSWSVSLPLELVAGQSLAVEAYDLQGNQARTSVATITPTFADRYAEVGVVAEAATIPVFGQRLSTKMLEERGTVAVICVLLTALIIAIGVHRHIQHVRMIANTAFVVMFATFLLLV